MADITVDAISFRWAVDSAIRSETGSNLGASPARSYASLMDSFIRSRCSSATEADFGTSPSPAHASASAADMRIVAARLSQAVLLNNATGHVAAARLFTLPELEAATNNFSLHNKIFGAGSIDVIYRGRLVDGREVAVKRGRTSSKMKGFQEVYGHLLTLLLRLHHKHLVGLVGFCEEKDKRFLVYEYMKNGTLYDHLHERSSSELNYWKMRIKIALDASRGIEYLHKSAVPSIIRRDIKSSNILLDATWTAKVSDFESPSFMSPEPDRVYMDIVLGTLGYLDPAKYMHTSLLTAKSSDVYGLGVVLLELLTGKKTILRYGKTNGGTSMVNIARRAILAGELVKILDPKVGAAGANEAEALELVANTAIHCVNFNRKKRSTIDVVVANLERALAICDSSNDIISNLGL